MKDLAQRTENLAQSDIRAITAMVKASDGINLGQGICDLPVPEAIRRSAQRAIDEEPPIYTPYAGIDRLRSAIRAKVVRYNRLPVVSDEEIMVSAGATGAFVTAIFALLNPGDEAILFEPFYGYHRNLIRLTGARPTYVPLQGPDFRVDVRALQGAVTSRTKAVVVCTPGNPSGKVWTQGELEQLLGVLDAHDLYAVTDEIYEHMVYDGRTHVSLGSLPGAYDRTVTVSGFSKTFNVTGWRLGYAVGPERLIGTMGLLNDLFYICASAPLQYGVADALPMDPSYFEEMQASYSARRRLMCETLESCGFQVSWPEGAYYVMADFSPLADRRAGFENDGAASETLIREAGVAAVPGRSFFRHPAAGGRYLRFCYAKELEELEDACRRLRGAFAPS